MSQRHGEPHFVLSNWLGAYVFATPGLRAADNTTVRLDLDNEPQPDLHLRILPTHGGRARVDADGYIEGAPDMTIEVAASSVSYDLHDKLRAYRRNGITEYLVLRVDDAEIDWFVLLDGTYERLAADEHGVLRSVTFAGLWLDVAALLRGDIAGLLATVQRGLATAEHAAFVAQLALAKRPG